MAADLIQNPTSRKLRIFAFDPSVSGQFDTAGDRRDHHRHPMGKPICSRARSANTSRSSMSIRRAALSTGRSI